MNRHPQRFQTPVLNPLQAIEALWNICDWRILHSPASSGFAEFFNRLPFGGYEEALNKAGFTLPKGFWPQGGIEGKSHANFNSASASAVVQFGNSVFVSNGIHAQIRVKLC